MHRTGVHAALTRTLRSFMNLLPVMLGMLLLTSLIFTWLAATDLQDLFARHGIPDVLLGALLGSVAAGPPVAGYILGGEILEGGASLIGVTALIVSWVTVGVVQLPAEMLLLGRRFAIYRNLLCFLFAIVIAYLAVGTLRFFG
ncbi:MAG: hypothetical protein J5I92_00590 [Thiogranum sp.]|nr:hypothetical protein [Thiogranum sp.]